MRTEVICFTNNKGGSGKSTACSNLGSALARAGRRVLLVDGDMQMNLSLSFLEEERVLQYAAADGQNLWRAVRGERSLPEMILKTGGDGPDLVAGSMQMSEIERELLARGTESERVLSELLREVRAADRYDYILIDSPPTLGCWVRNILRASDWAVIPVEATPWGLFGLANMMEFLRGMQEAPVPDGGSRGKGPAEGRVTRPDIPSSPAEGARRAACRSAQLAGILVNKADERKNYYHQTMETLAGMEDIPVFHTVIHIDSAVEWAQDASRTVTGWRRSSRSAREYAELAKEVEERCR